LDIPQSFPDHKFFTIYKTEEHRKIRRLCHTYNTTVLGITPFKLTDLIALGYCEFKRLSVDAAF
jgi:hypothetical protein